MDNAQLIRVVSELFDCFWKDLNIGPSRQVNETEKAVSKFC